MARRKYLTDYNFIDSAVRNNATYLQYYNRLKEFAISSFKWKNLPKSIDERFLELILFEDGKAIFFKDDGLDDYLALQTTIGGKLNVYRIPIKRRAYSVNGYRKYLDENDSVIIYNNMIHTNALLDVRQFALKLYNIDRAIDVNANAQKTPIIVQCTENEKLTLTNLYKEYDGNAPVIYANKNLDLNGLKVLKTDAPYVADKLYTLKTQIWNEALTYLGITNNNNVKKERLITDEVIRNNGGVVASRFSRLNARQQACEQINDMFGLNISVEFKSTVDEYNEGVSTEFDNGKGGVESE